MTPKILTTTEKYFIQRRQNAVKLYEKKITHNKQSNHRNHAVYANICEKVDKIRFKNVEFSAKYLKFLFYVRNLSVSVNVIFHPYALSRVSFALLRLSSPLFRRSFADTTRKLFLVYENGLIGLSLIFVFSGYFANRMALSI